MYTIQIVYFNLIVKFNKYSSGKDASHAMLIYRFTHPPSLALNTQFEETEPLIKK